MTNNRNFDYLGTRLSRRRLLQISGGAVGSMTLVPLLAACGGDDDDDDDEEATPTTADSDAGDDATTTSADTDSGDDDEPTAADDDSGDSGSERQGGELNIGSIQEPDSLNPWLTGLIVALEVENMIYDSLTRVNPQGDHVPALAVEVPSVENGGISEDLMTYTYKLRDDVTWHDGEPFTSADVVFTYEAIADPEVNARARIGFDLIESVEAPDDHTVVFNLTEPSGVFLESWGYRGTLPKHKFEGQDMNTTDLNINPTVGTGAYKFVEWRTGERIVLERNENYYREGAYLDQINYLIIPNSDTLLAMQETGEIDMRFVLSAEHVAFAQDYEDFLLLATPAHSYFHFTINLDDPILGDKNVRHALTFGLNKTEITETILQDLYDTQWSPISQPSWAFVDPAEKMEYDPEQAKQLLEEAGWTGGDGEIRQKDGASLTLNIMNIAGDTERLQVVQLAQAHWREIGVEVNIDPVDAPTFVSRSSGGDFQWAYGFWSWSVDPSGYNERWLSTSTANWAHYNNEEVDQLLLDALQTVDRDERTEMYARFQEIVIEDATNIFLYNRVFYDAVKTRVKGFEPNPSLSTNMWNAHEWWIED